MTINTEQTKSKVSIDLAFPLAISYLVGVIFFSIAISYNLSMQAMYSFSALGATLFMLALNDNLSSEKNNLGYAALSLAIMAISIFCGTHFLLETIANIPIPNTLTFAAIVVILWLGKLIVSIGLLIFLVHHLKTS